MTLALGHPLPSLSLLGPHSIPHSSLVPTPLAHISRHSFVLCILYFPSYPPVRFLCTFGFRARKVPRATGSPYIGCRGFLFVLFATPDPPLSSPRYPQYTPTYTFPSFSWVPLLCLCITSVSSVYEQYGDFSPFGFSQSFFAHTEPSCPVWYGE